MTQEELNNFEEGLRLKKESFEIDKKSEELSKGSVDISYELLSSLREALGIRSRTRDLDRAIFNNAKAINRQLLGQETSLANIREYTRETLKNDKLLIEARALENAALREVNDLRAEGSVAVDNLLGKAEERDKLLQLEKVKLYKQLELEKAISKEKEKQSGDQPTQDLQDLLSQQVLLEEGLNTIQTSIRDADYEFDNLLKGKNKEGEIDKLGLQNDKERAAFFAVRNKKQLESTQAIRKQSAEALAPTEQLLSLLGNIPGLGKVTNDVLNDTIQKIDEQISKQGKNADIQKIVTGSQKEAFTNISKQIFSIKVLGSLVAGVLLKSFLNINKAQTSLRQNLGESYDTTRNLSSEFSTVSDTLAIANSLVEQFGFNVNAAFSGETVLAASELVEAVGLTAEQAGQLAFLTTISGQNLNDSLDSAIKTVNPLLSQRQILQQVGQVSSYIALNFDNQVESLVQAAAQAKELGLELNQVNKIADGLLDIESSIASEFQAEILTGKQLNLERARFFALTNDLAGVTEEIAKNQEIINAFAGNNRVAQQAIAEALGLGADELATMIQEQKLLSGLSEEERKKKELADIRSLDLQTRLAKVLQTIAEESVVLLEPLALLLKGIGGAINYIVEGFKTLKPIIAAAAIGATGFGLAMLAAGAATITLSSFLNPFGAAIATIASLAAIGFMKSEFNKAKTVGDAIIPAGKGPIISTREGGLIQGTANDDIIMAPGIARGGRNAGLSQADITAIAKAVRDGASQAQINLDGGRVSNRLQPSLAVNTRKYSI